jgi:hypothetical protein
MGPLPTASASPAPSYTKENQAGRMRELAPTVVLTCAQGLGGNVPPEGLGGVPHSSQAESESGSEVEEDSSLEPDVDAASLASVTQVSRLKSAAIRSGRTNAPALSRFAVARLHHESAIGRSASLERIVLSKRRPNAQGSEYCASGSTGTDSGMPRRFRAGSTPFFLRFGGHNQTGDLASGRTATSGKGRASSTV